MLGPCVALKLLCSEQSFLDQARKDAKLAKQKYELVVFQRRIAFPTELQSN